MQLLSSMPGRTAAPITHSQNNVSARARGASAPRPDERGSPPSGPTPGRLRTRSRGARTAARSTSEALSSLCGVWAGCSSSRSSSAEFSSCACDCPFVAQSATSGCDDALLRLLRSCADGPSQRPAEQHAQRDVTFAQHRNCFQSTRGSLSNVSVAEGFAVKPSRHGAALTYVCFQWRRQGSRSATSRMVRNGSKRVLGPPRVRAKSTGVGVEFSQVGSLTASMR